MATKEQIWATGRRKSAVAQVRIKPGTGKYKVNNKTFEDYFTSDAAKGFIKQPLIATETEGKFDITVNLKGGGEMGQAGALRHGIARALTKYDDSLRSVLKNAGMLTRDARVKERKKPGQPGARKRFQFSKTLISYFYESHRFYKKAEFFKKTQPSFCLLYLYGVYLRFIFAKLITFNRS